jgi:hypothetical protein
MLRVRAGVLSYVLAIGILLSAGLSMLIVYLYYSRLEYKTYERRIRLLQNLEGAEEICKAQHGSLNYEEIYLFDIYQNGSDSVSIQKRKWGLLDRFHVATFQQTARYEKGFFLGYYPNRQGRSAVYMHNERGNLSLTGDAKITGDCYLPKGGVQSAYINRVGYTGEKLVYGQTYESSNVFPKINLKEEWQSLAQLSGVNQPLADSLYSFKNETEILEQSSFHITDTLQGNLILKTNGRAVFTNIASCSDIIVVASVIEFEEGFRGSGQFFASDTIIVHKNVKLDYPTVLAVYNPFDKGQIYVEEGAEISGWLLLDGENDGFRRRLIYLENDSKVNGFIYCNGMVESYGKIDGHISTRRFLVNIPNGIYENYLLNSQIDATALHPEFLTLSQWFYSDSTEVMKYIY